MKVYRVECPEQQRGPYHFSATLLNDEQLFVYERMIREHKNHSCWPVMSNDLKNRHVYYLTTIRSAFPSKPKCKEWFGEFLPFLLNIGFEVYQYEPTRVYTTHSGKQIGLDIKECPRKIVTHLFKQK